MIICHEHHDVCLVRMGQAFGVCPKKQGSRAIAASLLTIGRRVRGFVCHDIL